ncbi:MAG: histidine kinase [Bacteroidaceae bacterium]|nr:histidine kinase [Bacteroidaceae bacterium]
MKQSRQENLIYLAVWGLLFAAPLLSLYVRTVNDPNIEFDWSEVFFAWRLFAVYLLLFLIHNFLLAPLLVHGGKRVVYYASVAAMLMAFTLYQCNQRPERRNHRRPPMERVNNHQPSFAEPHAESPTAFDGERPPLPDDGHLMKGKRPRNRDHKAGPRPPFVGERDILTIVVLVLMFGANLGIKFYYRSRDDQKRLAELEHENLEQQLEYLRYQINPHFFMNTLNNIHALVDIDPEQAKDTILELSKMMRFVLYEGNKKDVPISREFDFIRHYVALMQLRYTEKVKITLDMPQESPDRQIPPLILITFIENAFKHGISYQRESFIDINVAVEGEKLKFKCSNSKADQANEEKGGVGLDNVRKRLNLLYDNNYTLDINDTPDIYHVELVIPLKS